MQLPPSGCLKSLPADSGLAHSFAGTDRLLVVGLAQWSDGRAVDYQALIDKLEPLIGAVTRPAGVHDHG